jgi:hypothetical protein
VAAVGGVVVALAGRQDGDLGKTAFVPDDGSVVVHGFPPVFGVSMDQV